ncbi:LacI family DNA-binding transcriptional regulator [Arthrobacter sp. LAPM80]|uniref:LacI family DNA-binding transcriptional regulator n=1 Tax=Arthrobacter sp. LAPM80 TaxID=3141788 RepID=UPI00398AFD31
MSETTGPQGTASPGPAQARSKRRDPGRKHAPTIYDIAELAGFNPSTVSRALSQPGRVSAKTQKIIEDAAAELNYQVNIFARALPTGRTQTIGLIVSGITNPAHFDVIRGAETTSAARNHTLMLADSRESAELELTAAHRMLTSVDGLVLVSPRLSDEELQRLAAKKPVAVINRRVEGVPSVVAEMNVGVTDAVQYLATLGHAEIAYVAGPQRSWMSQSRWESISARCEWSGILATLLGSGEPTVDGGRKAAAAVKAGSATAVFCYNDLMAIGLLRELLAAGVKVPGEISIIGFDNIFGSDFTTPPLSTIKSPLYESGAAALNLILELLDNGESHQKVPLLRTELVLRGSTGAISR